MMFFFFFNVAIVLATGLVFVLVVVVVLLLLPPLPFSKLICSRGKIQSISNSARLRAGKRLGVCRDV